MMRQLNTSIGRWTLLSRQQSIVPTSTLFFETVLLLVHHPLLEKLSYTEGASMMDEMFFIYSSKYLFCNVSKKSLTQSTLVSRIEVCSE